jgi:hypothetical protein
MRVAIPTTLLLLTACAQILGLDTPLPSTGEREGGATDATVEPLQDATVGPSDASIADAGRGPPVVFVTTQKLRGDFRWDSGTDASGPAAAEALCVREGQALEGRNFVPGICYANNRLVNNVGGGSDTRWFRLSDAGEFMRRAAATLEFPEGNGATTKTDGNGYVGDVWTGCNPGGNASVPSCSGWTTSVADAGGTTGLSGSGGHPISFSNAVPCDSSFPIYCIEVR